MHLKRLLIVAAAALFVLPASAKIVSVDGDTVREVGGERVRLLGYDTPEMERTCQAEKDLGLKAKRRLNRYLNLKNVRLVYSGQRDLYGRPLARLMIGNTDVASLMIRSGLAVPYDGRGPRQWRSRLCGN